MPGPAFNTLPSAPIDQVHNSASLTTFSAPSQAMAARGYVVFSPNYRGSDNFGNAFYRAVVRNAGDGPGVEEAPAVPAMEGAVIAARGT